VFPTQIHTCFQQKYTLVSNTNTHFLFFIPVSPSSTYHSPCHFFLIFNPFSKIHLVTLFLSGIVSIFLMFHFSGFHFLSHFSFTLFHFFLLRFFFSFRPIYRGLRTLPGQLVRALFSFLGGRHIGLDVSAVQVLVGLCPDVFNDMRHSQH